MWFPLLALRDHTWSMCSGWGSPRQERHRHTPVSLAESHKGGTRLEHRTCKEQLREPDLFSLQERRWRCCLQPLDEIIQGRWKQTLLTCKMGWGIMDASWHTRNTNWGNISIFLIIKLVKHWNMLSREVLESMSREIFRTQLELALVWVRGWIRWPLEVFSRQNYCMISMFLSHLRNILRLKNMARGAR